MPKRQKPTIHDAEPANAAAGSPELVTEEPVAPEPGPEAAASPPAKASGKGKRARRPALPVPQIATEVQIRAAAVTGSCPPLGPGVALILLQNGGLASIATTEADGAFAFKCPNPILSGRIEVIEAASGRSRLAGPMQVAAGHRLRWQSWSCKAGRIEGSFTLEDAAEGDSPAHVLVQAFSQDQMVLQVAASPVDGVYRFSGALRTVLPVNGSMVVRPRVAGLDLDEALQVTSADVGYIGHLDPDPAEKARGWAIDLGQRERRVPIELRLDGTATGTTVASQLRADIRSLGWSDGHSGFEIPFPGGVDRRQPIRVHAYIAGTETELLGSPYVLEALPPVMGCLDVIEGPFAGGWAINMPDPEKPLEVEAVCEGEVIGAGTANLYRGDVQNAGLPTPWCGFRFLLDRPLVSLFDKDIYLRVTGTEIMLEGSPRQIKQNSNIVRFLTRSATMPPATLARLSRRMTHRTSATLLSIIMPVYNTRREWLVEALNSVLGQWSANWELICVDDGSTEPHVAAILKAASQHDRRIRTMISPGNMGIARATNFGLRAARGQFVAFMDHDDVIEPDAVYKLSLAAQETGADLIYSDEAITTDDINSVIEVRARPAFSHDYYLSHPYFVHMIAVRTTLAQQLGGWDESLSISADVDFVLRAIEGAGAVAHVPSVLYRWRTHGGSAGHDKQAKVTATMIDVVSRHLARQGRAASVRPGFRYNEYRVDWPDDGGEVLIVIPTKNRVDLLKACIDSVEKTSRDANYRIVVIDHESTDKKTVRYLEQISGRHTIMPYRGVFNYAAMNNLTVKTHAGQSKYVLFLNNDVEAREDGWIPRMRSLAARPEVGAVGPLLLYGDTRVQHAGVLIAFSGAADHAMKFQDAYLTKGKRHPGYNCNLTSVRDYSAATAACLMVRMDVFKQVRGFDEKFVVGFNDTDLCLRIGEAGYKILYDGFSVLYHHESATRTQSNSVDHPEDDARLRTRWRRFFTKGDPFYSPLLAPKGTDHTLRQDSPCGMQVARVQRLGPKLGLPTASGQAAPGRGRRVREKGLERT